MSLAKDTIAYLKSCFEVDNRGNIVSSIFSSRISRRLFFKEGSFFSDWNELYLLDNEYASDTLKDLQIHLKEKELKVGLFFINFESEMMGKVVKNICPLFLFDAEILQDEYYFLSLKQQTFEINPIALHALESTFEVDIHACKSEIEELIDSSKGVDEAVVLRIKMILEKYFDTLDLEGLYHYPEFVSQQTLKRKSDGMYLHTAGCLFVQERAKNTQSILDELERLLEDDVVYSRLLMAYLNQSFEQREINHYAQPLIKSPAILSEAQTSILRDVFYNQCSVVTGPPGTGKSFTIAAAAINEALNGKSVLIVTGTDHANNAIEDKITETFQLTNLSARISKNRSYRAVLNRNFKKWLEGVGLKRGLGQARKYAHQLEQMEDRLIDLETQLFELTEDEIKLGELIYQYKRGIVNKIKSFFLRISLDRIALHPDVVDEFLELTKELVHVRRKYIQVAQKEIIKESIEKNREHFLNFREALNAKKSGSIKELFDKIDFDILTSVFPIWISTVTDIGLSLPMKKDMFDLVIVDEASQIDMATILPIFQRAKKAIICGDTEQLSPVTFLSSKKQKELAEKVENTSLHRSFNYREASFLDICHCSIKDQSQLYFLDEHYRSLPDIISFSNERFYNNELRIMTQLPQHEGKKGLEIIDCKGIRTKDGINEAEAQQCIQLIQDVINSEYVPVGNSSIGVLSPFRKQVNYLESLISQTFELKKIKRHQIICGTAHTFQGNERDIMLISMVVDNHAHHGAFMHINKSDVFNVSITRARNKQYILHSITSACKFKDHLLYQYLFSSDFETFDQVKPLENDLSLEAVTKWLKEHFSIQECQIDYVIAGVNIDIWAKINNKYVGFDAIGFPGRFETAININKLKILSRLDIKVLPISLSNFLYHKDELKSVISRNIS